MKSFTIVGNLLGSLLVVVLGLFASPTSAKPVTFTAANTAAPAGSEVRIPIQIQDSPGLGAIQCDLVYDPSVLSPINVELGSQGSGLVAHNVVDRGRLRIALATSDAISSDGELLVVTGKVLGGSMTPLALENGRAWGHGDAMDVPVNLLPGKLEVRFVFQPWMIGAAIGGGVLLLLMLGMWRKKRA